MSPKRPRTILVLACAACAAFTAGCLDMGRLEALRGQAAAMRDHAADQTERIRTAVDRLPPDDPAAEQGRAILHAAQARQSALDAAVRQVDLVLAEANNPADPITQAAHAAGAWLPEPARTPLLLAAAGLAAFGRAWRLKQGMASIARGLEAAMRDDEELRACFRRHADTFRAIQTPTAKRVVDEATRDAFMLRLPV